MFVSCSSGRFNEELMRPTTMEPLARQIKQTTEAWGDRTVNAGDRVFSEALYPGRREMSHQTHRLLANKGLYVSYPLRA